MNGTDIILTDRKHGLTLRCDRNVLYFGRAVDYMSTKQSYTFGRTYPKNTFIEQVIIDIIWE